MDANYGSIGRAQARERSGARTALALGAGGFLLGAVVVGLLWWNGIGSGDLVRIVREEAVEPVAVSSPTPTPQASPSEAAQLRAAAEVERVAEQQGGLDSRVAAMEQRLARLDLQTQAAAGNAARAEGLLVSFAARRALERGAPLGYLADQLQLRFGDAHPNSVARVVEFSRDPVTLDQLVARLTGLAPELVQAPSGEGVLGMIGREISSLFVVRRESTPSPRPERRLDRARRRSRQSGVFAPLRIGAHDVVRVRAAELEVALLGEVDAVALSARRVLVGPRRHRSFAAHRRHLIVEGASGGLGDAALRLDDLDDLRRGHPAGLLRGDRPIGRPEEQT